MKKKTKQFIEGNKKKKPRVSLIFLLKQVWLFDFLANAKLRNKRFPELLILFMRFKSCAIPWDTNANIVTGGRQSDAGLWGADRIATA